MTENSTDLPPRESGDGEEVEKSLGNVQQPSGVQNSQTQPAGAQIPLTQGAAAKIWSADGKFLTDIENLGFSKVVAEKALFYTGNKSADAAVCWILDHPEAQDDLTPLDLEGYSGGSSSSSSSPDEPFALGSAMAYKMIFVVNNSLKMGLGKIAAQVGWILQQKLIFAII